MDKRPDKDYRAAILHLSWRNIAITLFDPVAITPATRWPRKMCGAPVLTGRGAQLMVMKITDSGLENASNRYRRNQN